MSIMFMFSKETDKLMTLLLFFFNLTLNKLSGYITCSFYVVQLQTTASSHC